MPAWFIGLVSFGTVVLWVLVMQVFFGAYWLWFKVLRTLLVRLGFKRPSETQPSVLVTRFGLFCLVGIVVGVIAVVLYAVTASSSTMTEKVDLLVAFLQADMIVAVPTLMIAALLVLTYQVYLVVRWISREVGQRFSD